MRTNPTLSSHRRWSHHGNDLTGMHACGWAELQGTSLDAGALARLALAALREGTLKKLLGRLCGSFALIGVAEGQCVLAADAVRSIPLFWRAGSSGVAVGDDPERMGAGSLPLDPACASEFLAAGFVTGKRTLREGLFAVQAGQMVTLRHGAAEARDHFTYLCTYSDSRSTEQLALEHDETVMRAMERVVRSAGERQLVVPLSGGLDSRLVASCLARLGRGNVLCYTYGLPGNAEARRSEQVASTLGLPWMQVEYDPQAMRVEMAGDELRAFCRFATAQTSSPHVDEWFALKRLRHLSVVEENAVFLPGHTGDFICGGHLKHLFDPEHNADPYAFEEAMLRKHFSLWQRHLEKPEVRALLAERLRLCVGPAGESELESFEQLAAAYEFWEWRERQSRFIINSVRSYEWFGYGWRLPLWDRELMEFWMRVPLGFKHEKYLYRLALERHDPFGVYAGEALCEPWNREAALERWRARRSGVRRRLKRAVLSLPGLRELLRRRERRRRLVKQYEGHPLGIARCWDRREYLCRGLDKRHHQALITRDYLEALRREYDAGGKA